MFSTESAVLLITFNRPDNTRKVFEAIRRYQPKRLYISSDGPRDANHQEDWKKIIETRKIINDIDWECTVKTNFLDKNQGCGLSPCSAITWAFESEDKLIILEDDCIPSQSFFYFCNNLLQKYNDDTRIMHISGTRWNEEFAIEESDYFYTIYAHIWGWATWKRAWSNYNYQMEDWPFFKKKSFLHNILNYNFPLVKRWTFVFDNIYKLKDKHAWDYQWQYCIFKNHGLCINSTKNLITNIGDEGIHTTTSSKAHYRDREEVAEVLISPRNILPNYNYDYYHGRNFFLEDRGLFKLLYDSIIERLKFILNNSLVR